MSTVESFQPLRWGNSRKARVLTLRQLSGSRLFATPRCTYLRQNLPFMNGHARVGHDENYRVEFALSVPTVSISRRAGRSSVPPEKPGSSQETDTGRQLRWCRLAMWA